MTPAVVTPTLRDRLSAEGHSFDFYQAVRLLELLTGFDKIRFRSRISLAFPASDIYEIRFTADGIPEVIVNFMGLAGLLGPLPMPITEMILATQGNTRNPAPVVDFLDIFNHRLISLLYRVRQIHRPALTARAPNHGPVAQTLFALIGLGHPSLRNRMLRPGRQSERTLPADSGPPRPRPLVGLPDNALLFYSGTLARHRRSAIGLQRMLADYFALPVKIRQFVGRWRDLDPHQWTILGGKNKQNVRLGHNVVLGTRVWDDQTHIRIRLGPMPRYKYMSLLPGGDAHASLCDMVRFYIHPEMTFSIVLKLEKEEVFSPELGTPELRLGFTSWLSPTQVPADQTIRIRKDY